MTPAAHGLCAGPAAARQPLAQALQSDPWRPLHSEALLRTQSRPQSGDHGEAAQGQDSGGFAHGCHWPWTQQPRCPILGDWASSHWGSPDGRLLPVSTKPRGVPLGWPVVGAAAAPCCAFPGPLGGWPWPGAAVGRVWGRGSCGRHVLSAGAARALLPQQLTVPVELPPPLPVLSSLGLPQLCSLPRVAAPALPSSGSQGGGGTRALG